MKKLRKPLRIRPKNLGWSLERKVLDGCIPFLISVDYALSGNKNFVLEEILKSGCKVTDLEYQTTKNNKLILKIFCRMYLNACKKNRLLPRKEFIILNKKIQADKFPVEKAIYKLSSIIDFPLPINLT